MKEKDLDEMITSLNKKENISKIVISDLEKENLTQQEKLFFKTYQPEKALIIYGTLAPGKPNHSKIEHIKGIWKNAVINGKLENKGWGSELGFFGFMHSNSDEQKTIEANVLFFDELFVYWEYLDDFEGIGYKRILAKYKLENGKVGVGYIYAINESS